MMCGAKPCGKTDCTWGRKHLRECEARLVMTWPGERRAAFYEAVEKQRGQGAVARLKAEVKRQYALRSVSPVCSGSDTPPALF